jgi:CRP/FNR family transcriptional regulator
MHLCTAQALEDSSVFIIPACELQGLACRVPALNLIVHAASSRALSNGVLQAEQTAQVGSKVRLARFLLDQSRRMAACGQSASRLRLRMCRGEIASFLAMSPETVSRSFQALGQAGLVRVSQREVEICDIDRLAALCGAAPKRAVPARAKGRLPMATTSNFGRLSSGSRAAGGANIQVGKRQLADLPSAA